MMILSDEEINQRIDQIQYDSPNLRSETRNALHACRPNHPLGRGAKRSDLFANAIFVCSGRGVSPKHIKWLNRMLIMLVEDNQ